MHLGRQGLAVPARGSGKAKTLVQGLAVGCALLPVLDNLERVLAIELLNAAQAMEFRRPLRSSPVLEELVSRYREVVPVIGEDRYFHEDIVKSVEFVRKWE